MLIYTLFFIFIAIPLVGFAYQNLTALIDRKKFPPPGSLISIKNKNLHFSCKGDGDIAIVFEAGAGGTSQDWIHIQSTLANDAHVLIYDRAGLGWSEMGARPRTIGQIVTELHRLLHAVNLESTKIILVGHSFGGLVVQHYARTYPEGVVGMVLVDALHDSFLETAPAGISKLRKKEFSKLRLGILLSRFGIVRLLNLVQLPKNMPEDIKLAITALNLKTQTVRTIYSEAVSLEKSIAEIQCLPTLSPDLPVTVISRRMDLDAHSPGNRHWGQVQEALSKLTEKTTMIESSLEDHFVHFSDPNIVLQSLRNLIKTL